MHFKPEPLERLTFLLATVLVPLVMLLVLRGLASVSPYLTERAGRFAWMGAVAASIVATVAFTVHMQAGTLVMQEFFPPTPHPWVRVLLGLIVAGGALLLAHRIAKAWVAGAFAFTCLVVALAVALFSVSTTNEGPRGYLEGSDMDAVLYSIAQVAHGRGMLVDLANQYGLYPVFLEPLFRIVGLSVLSFTLTMWLLMSASFLCVALLLWNNITRKWVVPLALLSVAHYGYFSSRTWLNDDPYPQYHPIRFIFPCLCLYLFGRYIGRPSRALYYVCLLTASLSVFWNPDSGVAILGAWVTLLAYREFSSRSAVSALRETAVHAGRALILLLCLTAAYSGYALVRYHSLPHWALLTVNVPVFYRFGGMMLPLPPAHPWMLVIALYALTFARAGYWLLLRDAVPRPRQQLLLVTAALGTGLFIYYQGRSHDNNLTMVVWPAIVLLAFYLDELLAWRKGSDTRLMLAPASLAAFAILSFLCFPIVMIPDIVRATRGSITAKIHAVVADESGPMRRNIEMIKRYSKPGQPLAILSFRAGVYHAETGTMSAFTGPGLTEMLWRFQLEELEKQINALAGVQVFMDFHDVPSGSSESYFPAWATSLAHRWTLTEQNLSTGGDLVAFRVDDKSSTPVEWLLPEDRAAPVIAHVRSNGSSGSLTGEHGHFAGFGKITQPITARNLTIEAVVRPEAGQLPYATIVSTHPGSTGNKGFVVHRVPNHENFYVAIFGNGPAWVTGPEFMLPPQVISYVSVVLRDEAAAVYVNGEPVAHFQVPGGMATSDLPITVGNWERKDRQFNGRVIELYLSEGEMTAAEVAARWKILRPKIR